MGDVTMDEIAARAGVSRGAVSLALRRSPKISQKTTEHIVKVATEMGYRPNLNASRLARASYSTFGVLVSDLHNPIMADIIDGFVTAEGGEAPETYLASGFNSGDRERVMIESFLAHRVRGIVLLGSLLGDAEIQSLSRQVPTVSVGRVVDGVDSVLVDDCAGGRLAGEILLHRAHRHIAHVDGGEGAGADLRKRAFLEVVARDARTSVTVARGDYTQETGYRQARELLAVADPPTAIFAANDLTALGVLGAVREIGLVAGTTFDLVGFDDIAIAAYDYVSLTTISYSRSQMGQIARHLVQRRCNDPSLAIEVHQLEPKLIIRNTVSDRTPGLSV